MCKAEAPLLLQNIKQTLRRYRGKHRVMIHVLIERNIAEGMLSTYEQLLKTALQQTFVVHGFISGEAFQHSFNENRRYLLCKWRSQQDWDRWYRSRDRRELMAVMNPILSREEKITVLIS